jgi:hypothetical protein
MLCDVLLLFQQGEHLAVLVQLVSQRLDHIL